MPLAVRSEVDTWGDGDLGAFEDVDGQGPESHMTVCPAGRLDIYEGTLEYWSLACTPDELNRPAHKIIPVPCMEYLTHEYDTFIMRHIFDIKNYVLNFNDI
jgi:hypothetical protein